jgi:hypothetical protein
MESVLPREVVSRVAVFLCVLVLVVTAGWTLGQAVNPPIPVPELSRPVVLGGPGPEGLPDPGQAGAGQDGSIGVVPEHGHVR